MGVLQGSFGIPAAVAYLLVAERRQNSGDRRACFGLIVQMSQDWSLEVQRRKGASARGRLGGYISFVWMGWCRTQLGAVSCDVVCLCVCVFVQGETFIISEEVDSSILGGVIVQLGDKYVDLSTIKRIREIERILQEPV